MFRAIINGMVYVTRNEREFWREYIDYPPYDVMEGAPDLGHATSGTWEDIT